MRSLRLLAVAAEAEGFRLRREGQGLARRAALAGAAALLGLAALALLHVALWHLLLPRLGPAGAPAALAAGDVCLAGLLLLAARQRVDPEALEALHIRRTALRALGQSNPIGDALRGPLSRLAMMALQLLIARRRRP